MPTPKKKSPAKKTFKAAPPHVCAPVQELLAPRMDELRLASAKGDMKAKKALAAFHAVLAEL
tara:strand:- start:701 stop:886 length:186 start_codon:yes stop_codon:yes gene_type:complete